MHRDIFGFHNRLRQLVRCCPCRSTTASSATRATVTVRCQQPDASESSVSDQCGREVSGVTRWHGLRVARETRGDATAAPHSRQQRAQLAATRPRHTNKHHATTLHGQHRGPPGRHSAGRLRCRVLAKRRAKRGNRSLPPLARPRSDSQVLGPSRGLSKIPY